MSKKNKKEQKLKNIGFKKKWLDDGSGYWFEKKAALKIETNKCVKFKLYADPDSSIYYLEAKNNNDYCILFQSRKINKFLNWIKNNI